MHVCTYHTTNNVHTQIPSLRTCMYVCMCILCTCPCTCTCACMHQVPNTQQTRYTHRYHVLRTCNFFSFSASFPCMCFLSTYARITTHMHICTYHNKQCTHRHHVLRTCRFFSFSAFFSSFSAFFSSFLAALASAFSSLARRFAATACAAFCSASSSSTSVYSLFFLRNSSCV
jgi:hypothetical protein